MKLTTTERENIENYRRAAYLLAKVFDARLHRHPASEGEQAVIRKASNEMHCLVEVIADQIGRGPRRVTTHSPEIVHLGIRFFQKPPKGIDSAADLANIAAFFSCIALKKDIPKEGEKEAKIFVREFHEFLYREVLKEELPDASRATSLEARHG